MYFSHALLALSPPIFIINAENSLIFKKYASVCGKILEKIIFNNLYSYFHTNNLLTKNQSGFRPGDSTTNQLLYLLDEIHQAFDSTNSFEVRAVFLDISKAFDKVWHDGLIFKLE